MKPEKSLCKCLNCKKLFVPDYRNRGRQKYCPALCCQQASKCASQKAWLDKPENVNYFRDEENVKHVKAWRRKHPGYWKRSPRKAAGTLQETCSAQPVENTPVAPGAPADVCVSALQDVCTAQTPLLVGLIAQFTQSTLQEDIVVFVRSLIGKGQDILDQPSGRLNKNAYDTKTDPAPRPLAASSGAV
jgi:hypothetical protein